MSLKLLHICYSQPEAEVMRTSLDSSGIVAHIFDSSVTTTMPHMAIAVGGIRIMVAQSDLSEAQKVLGLRQDSELETDSEAFQQNLGRGFLGIFASFLLAWLPWWSRARKFKNR